MKKAEADLREVLIDAHAHFFILKENDAQRIRLWQILPDSIIIDRPVGAPMRKTILGYIPTIDGGGVYEIDGTVSTETLPDQMPNTMRVLVEPFHIKRINRRLYPRVNFTPPIDATAAAEGEKKSIGLKIINFSAGGIRIESAVSLAPRKKYRFNFKIETDNEVHDLSLAGTILYELPSDAGHAYGIGFYHPGAEGSKTREAPVEALDETISLMALVNKILIREG